MMKYLAVAAAILTAPVAEAQTMGPFDGRICSSPGPIFAKPTPACGAATFHAGVFKPGLFQTVYVSIGDACVPKEIFLRCQ